VLSLKIKFFLAVLLTNTILGKPKNKFLETNRVEELEGMVRNKAEARNKAEVRNKAEAGAYLTIKENNVFTITN